ncbi:hypothetical protein [Falsochrobactrum shanghaiense]|uniref:hypothetical protein n=1 Tax=Falsochrobactrum shanghaiense TaxID=2201899 RepID=UPI001304ECA5|nr:hypothetical protein [Falsochrobactrum shanghaiense]
MENEQDQIADLFHEAVSTFPAELQEQALEWLAQREAAYRLIREIEEKGPGALL